MERLECEYGMQEVVALLECEPKHVGLDRPGCLRTNHGGNTDQEYKESYKSTVIYADNQGAIKLAENPVFQKRSKHIAVKYHYTRDLIWQGEIGLEYKNTN